MSVIVKEGLRIHTVRRVASRALRQGLKGAIHPMEYPGNQTRFMCVRHPQDRLVSAWSHFLEQMQTGSQLAIPWMAMGYCRDMDFSAFLDIALRRHYADLHTSFQVDRMGEREIDILCPYEHLSEGWARLKVAFPFLKPLAHIGETRHRAWQTYYDPEQTHLTEYVFKEDMALYARAVKEFNDGRQRNNDDGSERLVEQSCL